MKCWTRWVPWTAMMIRARCCDPSRSSICRPFCPSSPVHISAKRWPAGSRPMGGVVVLPTGAGKTVVAMMAIEATAARTLVVVPTIELLEQWRSAIIEKLGIPLECVGIVGGGQRDVRPVTVTTYQSAMSPSRRYPDIGLLIFDEVHHLPAAGYRSIPRKVNGQYVLGLSATTERQDGRERDLDRLVGPEVYHKLPAELSRDKHIAEFVEKQLYVDLAPEERARY